MTATKAIPAALAALSLAGCGGSGPEAPPPPAEQPASAAGTFRDEGVTATVRAWNCRGVYGLWHVRVAVSGAARGEGAGTLTLRPGRTTTFRDEFRVRIAGVPATAKVHLRVRTDGDELDVEGDASARALFVEVRAPIDERLPVRRGAVPECPAG